MLTADEIRSRTFLVALRGYDRDEVKAFLVQVAEFVEDLQQRVRDTDSSPAEPGGPAVPPVTRQGPEPPAEHGREPPAAPSPFAELGRETQRILEAAQAAADDIRQRAHEDADREIKAARAQVTRIVAEGERRREEVERVVDALTGARGELADDLRAVGRTIERTLREFAPAPAAATVREALAATAREEHPPGEHPPGEHPPGEPQGDEPQGEEEAGWDAEAEERFVPEPDEPGREPQLSADRTEDAPADGGPAAQAEHETLAAALSRAAGSTPPGELATAEDGAVATGGNGSGRPPAQRTAAEEVLEPEPDGEATPSQVRRAEALRPLHPRLVRRLKRGLQDLQNATIDGLRRDSHRGDVERFLPDAAAVRSLSSMAAEQLRLAHAAGLAAGQEAIGAEVDVEPSARALADQLGSELGGVLVTRLAEALRTGFDEGEGLAALGERVDAVFAKIKNGPAGDVAAVALVRAYEGGQKDAWAAAGVSHRRWVRGVEPPCTDPRCVDNESVGSVPLDERFPSRHDAPPVRPGCSCSTAPAGG